ncbi:MAG: transcription termination/antitermination NusG family protein, partial [Cyanobium sp.]
MSDIRPSEASLDAAELAAEVPAPEPIVVVDPEEKRQVARWYAVQVASSCEKKVKATLEQRAVTLGVDNRILEIEIPQTPGVKIKKDGNRTSTEEKVFPGYV